MMKKVLVLAYLICTLSLQAQIKVSNVGNVGIGVSNPTYKLDVSTNMRLSGWTSVIFDWSGLSNSPSIYPTGDWYLQLGSGGHQLGNIFTYGMHTQNIWWDSDSTFKTNFNNIDSSITKLNKINGYKYQFTDEYLKSIPKKEKNKYDQLNYGFKAQEIQKIYPELTQKDDSTGKYSINYIGFIPILVQALKQQQNIINAQSLKIKELDDRLTKMEGKQETKSSLKKASDPSNSDSLVASSIEVQSNKSTLNNTSTDNSMELSNTFLFQNTPNPFTTKTEIKYFINEGIKKATLMIFDMQGGLKKQISINVHGLGSTTLEGSEFKAGMYIYSLIADGQEIASKRMILTEY